MKPSENILRITVAILTGIVLSPVVTAETFPASATIDLNCGGENIFQVGSDPGSFACQNQFVSADGLEVTTYADALTTNGTDPSISVSAATINNVEGVASELAASSSYQDLTYYFVLEEIAPAPFSVSNVPILFSSSADGETDSGHSYAGGVFIINSSNIGIGEEIDAQAPNFEFNFADSYVVGIDYRVTLEATCFSVSTQVGQSSCSLNVSSSLDFDQDVFDQLYGADAFLLSDYYHISMSPNLTSVPVPAAFWLMGAALMCLTRVKKNTVVQA